MPGVRTFHGGRARRWRRTTHQRRVVRRQGNAYMRNRRPAAPVQAVPLSAKMALACLLALALGSLLVYEFGVVWALVPG